MPSACGTVRTTPSNRAPFAVSGAASTSLRMPEDHVVGNEVAAFHRRLGGEALRRPGLHRGPQHVTGGDLRHAQRLREPLSLRSLPHARRPEQQNQHGAVLSS